MGKLKQAIIDLENADIDFVMHCYGSFLEYCMKNKRAANTWHDAIDAIHWSAYLTGRLHLSRLQIEHILTLRTESLYESYCKPFTD